MLLRLKYICIVMVSVEWYIVVFRSLCLTIVESKFAVERFVLFAPERSVSSLFYVLFVFFYFYRGKIFLCKIRIAAPVTVIENNNDKDMTNYTDHIYINHIYQRAPALMVLHSIEGKLCCCCWIVGPHCDCFVSWDAIRMRCAILLSVCFSVGLR